VKTTVEIADGLFQAAKAAAARRQVPLRELIEEGLRLQLERESQPRPPFRLQDARFRGRGGMVRDFTWPEIMEIAYEGRGGKP